ncbi:MAG: hypothetical protein ABI040_10250 [Rhodoferax sp.]
MNNKHSTPSFDDLKHRLLQGIVGGALMLTLAACGGGGTSGGNGPPAPGPITEAQRISAATATAQSTSNACVPIQPFYWEIGNQSASLASGSVQTGGGTPVYTGTTLMSIASASKWIYGAYVVQLRQGQLTGDDIKFLTFRSGYTNFTQCLPGQTVDGCVNYLQNGVYSAANDGKFSYGGGHMEKHADLNGLGGLYNSGLASAIQSQIGADVNLQYSQPQLAGGVVTTPDNYALFLRKILSGALLMKGALGTDAVCTNPTVCPAQAINTPVPTSESFQYSIGHWVENDPLNGDGAFSSAGAFGFYPWIDASKTWYGIVARVDTNNAGVNQPGNGFISQQCGQLIRDAWIDGVAR